MCVFVVISCDRCCRIEIGDLHFFYSWRPVGRCTFYACGDLLFPDMQEAPWVSAVCFLKAARLGRFVVLLSAAITQLTSISRTHTKLNYGTSLYHDDISLSGSPCACSRFGKVLDINVYKGLKTCQLESLSLFILIRKNDLITLSCYLITLTVYCLCSW